MPLIFPAWTFQISQQIGPDKENRVLPPHPFVHVSLHRILHLLQTHKVVFLFQPQSYQSRFSLKPDPFPI